MAGAGTEVGRISIKVTPDTDDFRRQLKNQLTAIEKSLKGQIPVNLNVNAAKAKGQLAASMAGLKAIAGNGVTVPVRTDSNGLGGALKNLRAGLLDFAKVAGQAGAGVRDYTREIKRMTLEQQKASPLLNHDLAVLRSHNEMRKRGIAVLQDFSAALRDQQTWLRQSNPALTENQAKFKVWGMALRDANQNATNGFKNFRAAFLSLGNGGRTEGFLKSDMFSKFGKDAEEAGNRASGAGRKIFGLTRVGWLIAAGFSLAAPAVGLVSGLIAGLPTLLMIAGAAAGAIAMGLDGIKAAASTIAPQWDAMRGVISQRFQDGLTPIFGQLAEKVFPVMQTGMLAVTDGLVTMAGGITNTLSSAQGLKQLETIFGGIGTFFTDITPAMSQFTNSFLQLGSAGAQSMGHLTGFISQFATQWQGMVDRVTNTPVFDGAMKGLSQALTGFTGLFTTLVESGLGAMAQLGEPLNNLFSGIGNLLSAAMPALTQFSAMIANVIGNLSNSLAPAFAALEPVMAAIRPVFESLATTLGGALSQAVVALAPGLTAIANVLGPVLTTAMTALAPILAQVATALGDVLLAAVTALAPLMPQLTEAFVQIASAISQGLAQFLPQVVAAFTALLPAVIQLVPIFLQFVPALVSIIGAGFQVAGAIFKMLEAFMPLVGVLTSVVAKVGEVIAVFVGLAAAIVSKVAEAVTGVINWFTNMVTTVLAKIGEIVTQGPAKFMEFGSKAVEAVKGFVGNMVSAGADLIKGLINGIGSMIGAAVSKVKEVGSAVVGAITGFLGIDSPSKVFTELGEFTMEGFQNGLDSGGKDAVAKIKEIAKAVFEAAKEVFGNAGGLNLAFNLGGGGTAAGGLSGLSSQLGSATSAAKGFQSSITNSVNPTRQMTEESKAQTTELSRQLSLLEMRRKELELARTGLGKGPELDAIKAELDSIRTQKLALGLQKDQLTYAQKYEGSVSNTNQKYDEQIKKLANMPVDFAKTTATTALNDFGISGGGALGAIADYGMELGSKFVFNVNSVDEAFKARDNAVNLEALGKVGR